MMSTTILPPPIEIDINDYDSLEKLINFIYENHFKLNFMDKYQRPKLFGKFIFLDLDFINYKPERFWHIISFEAEEEKYTVNPCINIADQAYCNRMKTKCDEGLFLPKEPRLENRAECIYRMRRLNLLNPIIDLANAGSTLVKVWTEDEITADLKNIRKVYIRYQDDLIDYLIILIDGSITGKNGYKFVTAYPVVHNGTKRRLDNCFKNYAK